MAFIRRTLLFILTNIAVVVTLSIVLFLLQKFFGISLGVTNYGILIFAAVVGFGGAFVSLFMSKGVAKRAYKLTQITAENLGDFNKKEQAVYRLVEQLAERNNIKTPEVGIYSSAEPNAFATGASKNASLVAVSTGLLDSMSERAIEGVIGHEMAHILNGDMVTMTLLQGILNTFVVFFARIAGSFVSNRDGEGGSNMFVTIALEMVFGLLAGIIVAWFSRYREFRADEGSAKYLGKEKMIAALQSLQKAYPQITSTDDSPLATMKISTKKGGSIFGKLFSSHPPLSERIKNMENMRII